METHRRGSDGRRRFSPKFKREQIGRVLRGEVTVAQLSPALGIEQSVLRRWKHLTKSGARRRSRRVRMSSRLVSSGRRCSGSRSWSGRSGGRRSRSRSSRRHETKQKKAELPRPVQAMTGRKLAPICRTLRIGRSSAYRESQPRPGCYARAEDRIVTAQIRSVIRTRASYGARRVRAMANRDFATAYTLKRIRRVMEVNWWKLPRSTRRRARSRTACRRRS